MINNFIGIGRTTKEIELKYSQAGLAIANFTIAIDRGLSKVKKEEAESKGQPTTDFIRVVCFGGTAEFVANYVGKGKLIGVNGRVQTGSYDDKDGKRIFTTDVLANNVDILEWKDDKVNIAADSVAQGFQETSEDIPF